MRYYITEVFNPPITIVCDTQIHPGDEVLHYNRLNTFLWGKTLKVDEVKGDLLYAENRILTKQEVHKIIIKLPLLNEK